MTHSDPEIDALLGPEPEPEPARPPTRLPATVSASELAPLLGLTANRVGVLAKDGVIPKAGRGKYPLPEAVTAYVQWARENPTGRRIKDPDLADEKRRLTAAQADRAEAVAARERGELVSSAAVAAEWAALLTDLRAAILAIPARVATSRGLDRAAAADLDAEIRRALTAISEDDMPTTSCVGGRTGESPTSGGNPPDVGDAATGGTQ